MLACSIMLVKQNATAQKKNNKFSISGEVLSADGSPLKGASIYIQDIRKGAISDSAGKYKIPNIPYGNYLIEVRFLGYSTVNKSVFFNDDVTENFTMELSVVEESEVVVTGTSKAGSIKRNPIQIVSVSRQYLNQNLSSNIIDAISKIPGISSLSTGPNVSKPFIRGLGYNRILTLYDGVRQEGQQWGDEHGIEVDQNTIDKIEIVKGPASLIYGSDAIAGVVNLIPANPPPKGIIKGNILTAYKTNNKEILNSESIAGNIKDVNFGLVFSNKQAIDYKNKIDGRVYNTGFKETDLSGNFGINKNWGFSKIGFSTFNSLQEIPDGSRDSFTRKFTKQINEEDTYREIVSNKELNSYTISDIHQHVQHYRIYNVSSFTVGGGRIALNLGAQKSIRREYNHPEAVSVPGLYLKLNSYTYDFKYFFHESKGFSVTTGINGMIQKNDANSGTEFLIPTFKQNDIGAFIYAKKSLNKIEIAGGLRYDVRKFNNDDLYIVKDSISGFEHAVTGSNITGAEKTFNNYSKSFSGFSGSLGLSYVINKEWSLKANLSQGYRSPNISEISANGVHSGTNVYQIGNLDFKPEFNLQQDVSVNYNSTHVTINAAAFNNSVRNYIYNEKVLSSTGLDSVIVEGTRTFKFVSSRAQLYGGEIVVDIHPHPFDWLHFENSLSMVYGINKGNKNDKNFSDSSANLPDIPPVRIISELRANIKRTNDFISNSFIKVEADINFNQNRPYLENGSETFTPGYVLINAGLGTDITNKKGQIIFHLNILANNLLNKAYQSHLSRLKYFEDYPNNASGRSGIYNMGSNFSINVNIPFNIRNKIS